MNLIPLYIHVPFCRSKCAYCTFYSISDNSPHLQANYINELLNQIKYYLEEYQIDGFKTLYLGGGTPSMLDVAGLSKLLDGILKNTDLPSEEFTIECNPEDINEEFIQYLNNSPVDRISLGVQSFSEKVLKASGRNLSFESIDKSLNYIHKYWNGRLNLDLITGLPGQTLSGQEEDIRKAVEAKADHISCYSLIISENTPIASSSLLPSEDLEGEMWELCRTYLIAEGFSHYEVSNFARPGHESLHNLEYWKMNPYLGCGPGAVGMLSNKEGEIFRTANPHNIHKWLAGEKENWNINREIIKPLDFLFENYMMGLRTDQGISRPEFKKRFGRYPEEFIRKTIESYPAGTFVVEGESFKLSEEARLYMNSLLLNISSELDSSNFDFTVNWP